MSDLRKAAEMALDAIDVYGLDYMHGLPKKTYVKALRAALAQPEQDLQLVANFLKEYGLEVLDVIAALKTQPDTEMQTYKDALTWISSVNAMDYEYQRKAINALKAHGIGGEHE
jgi:coproporphyrinogen III oxidase-like Fe-S oxidoreductase